MAVDPQGVASRTKLSSKAHPPTDPTGDIAVAEDDSVTTETAQPDEPTHVGSRPRPRPAPPMFEESDAEPPPATLAGSLGVTLPAIVRREKRRRGRRVKRVVRRIELWSVLKVSMLFYICLYAATLGAGVLLWGFAHSAGLIDNFESFMQEVGFDDFRFFGDKLFRQAALIGGALVLASSVLTVLATALLNLISEVTGGIRFVVIEEDLDESPSASRS